MFQFSVNDPSSSSQFSIQRVSAFSLTLNILITDTSGWIAQLDKESDIYYYEKANHEKFDLNDQGEPIPIKEGNKGTK
jgi:hypothetical protein